MAFSSLLIFAWMSEISSKCVPFIAIFNLASTESDEALASVYGLKIEQQLFRNALVRCYEEGRNPVRPIAVV